MPVLPVRLTPTIAVRAGLAVVDLELPGVRAFVTTRDGGVSRPPFGALNLSFSVGDDETAVTENRRRVAAAAGVDPGRLVAPRQVHGADVAVVDGSADVEADAVVTSAEDLAVAVLVADCVPVLLVARDESRVGVAHAGWRGLDAGVLPAAVREVGPGEVRAVIGPAISARRYQVGPEVAERFADVDGAVQPDEGDRSRLDLVAVALAQLRAAGVDDESIAVLDATTDDDAYFSARAASPTGRFALVAVRTMGTR
ncbi:MAG TPA: polyphenol oxidase family protein [Acidimicrobiales bacterium]|nr:polyphenol oxidase family protein [Acidimicrobiales bacterium]